MLCVDKSLSYLNDMLHNPCVFRLNPLKEIYVSKSTLNAGVNMNSSNLLLPYHLLHYKRIQSNLHSNREFLIFLVFKLLERGVYISARNIAILENPVATTARRTPLANKAEHTAGNVELEGNNLHDSPKDVRSESPLRAPGANRKIVHCDIIAFNAKKKQVYAIVVCDDIVRLQQCRAHASRVADSIRHIIPPYSTMLACVLTVYNFEHSGVMRLCVVTKSAPSMTPIARSQPKRTHRCSVRIRDRAQSA